MKKILLIGNPNVGKSAIFSRLTGANVIASNYPGTTVELTQGMMKLPNGEKAMIIDVPGNYTLDPTCRAEEVACDLIGEADVIINVIDSTNLERNLNLTIQILKHLDTPVVIALNMWDSATQHGVTIDVKKFSEILGVDAIPTSGISGEGIKELTQKIPEAKKGEIDYEEKEKWHFIGDVIEAVQKTEHRHPTVFEWISNLTIQRVSGPILAVIILYISFMVIRLIGEGLIGYVMDPIFDKLWLPVLEKLSVLINPGTFFHKILIGQLVNGEIDFGLSFGLLSTGLYIPLAAVLPYIVSFYLVLSILEDVGYLPRLGVLVDNIMHRLGLHGLSIVPMLLGLGCNVPGALATRILETRKERFIAATLMAIAVPCMAQIAMISGLLGKYGVAGFFPLFGILFAVWLTLGFIMKKTVKGETPEIIVDMPPYRLPYWKGTAKKLWMRVRGFVAEAVPFVLIGVFVVDLLYSFGIIQFIGKFFSPIIVNVFGLPKEAIGALIIGFMRKDVAVGMLAPLGLSLRQLIVASAILTIYFPCIATFIVLIRELGVKDMIKSALIMLITAFIVGGLANWAMRGLGM
ncbi:ferrous iron transporter B [bacterium]|nr:ferrous iron transporter B [bacterium]